MPLARCAVALVAAVLLLASACADVPTAPRRPEIASIPAGPHPGVFTPLLLPPGGKWSHSFVSFNPDRFLAINVVQYYDGHAGDRGTFVIPGLGSGVLEVTTIESTSSDCVPWGTPCAEAPEPKIPESSTASGIGFMGATRLMFTLELQSHLWPPPGTGPPPAPDPGTDYDTATLTICTASGCTTTTFYGELHHEPT
jgi:hypothetical protein